MAKKLEIQVLQSDKSTIDGYALKTGEPALAQDTKQLIIGDSTNGKFPLSAHYVQTTKPTDAVNGAIWTRSTDGITFKYHSSITKWLSIDTFKYSCSRNGNVRNVYLRKEDSTPTNTIPFLLPYDMTMIGFTLGTAGIETWDMEVEKSGVLFYTYNITASDRENIVNLNLDFTNTDYISVYCNSSNVVSGPTVDLLLKIRG